MPTVRAFRFVSVLSVMMACSAVPAATVYTWVDAQGVRHFSQTPPADTDQAAETLKLDTPPAQPAATDRLQSIRDVARELEQSRQQREQQRAQSASPPPAAPAPEPQKEAPVWVVPYPAYPPYPGVTPYPRPYPYPYPPPGPHKPGPDRPDDKPSVPKLTPSKPKRVMP